MPQLKDLFDVRFTADFIGRDEELDFLLQVLDPDGPVVVYLHGIAGAGKSTLLEVFNRRARAAGATVIRLDCRAIEPTEAGFLSELTIATGGPPGSPHDVALRLGQVGTRVIVALDTYEVFRLMDSWLRQVFVPLLPDRAQSARPIERLAAFGDLNISDISVFCEGPFEGRRRTYQKRVGDEQNVGVVTSDDKGTGGEPHQRTLPV